MGKNWHNMIILFLEKQQSTTVLDFFHRLQKNIIKNKFEHLFLQRIFLSNLFCTMLNVRNIFSEISVKILYFITKDFFKAEAYLLSVLDGRDNFAEF